MSIAEEPAGAFTLTPTPDDGTRLSEQLPWDESDRPTGPAPDPRRSYSPLNQINTKTVTKRLLRGGDGLGSLCSAETSCMGASR